MRVSGRNGIWAQVDTVRGVDGCRDECATFQTEFPRSRGGKGRVSPRVVQARWRGTRALSRSGRTSGNAIPVATRGQPHEVLMSAGLNQPRPTPPVVSPSSRHRLLASGRWKKFSRLFCIPRAPIFFPSLIPFSPLFFPSVFFKKLWRL